MLSFQTMARSVGCNSARSSVVGARANAVVTHCQQQSRSMSLQSGVRACSLKNVFMSPLAVSTRGGSIRSTTAAVAMRNVRFASTSSKHSSASFSADMNTRNNKIAIYVFSVVIGTFGVSYASVPLYKVFCQATGFGGTTQEASTERAKHVAPVPGASAVRVTFAGTVTDTLAWKFKPQQREIKVVPGETALAFFTAHNPTNKPVTGVATYNVTPAKAGIYFNKIQCFCFDEQRLKAGEEVDMPIFFYIDPEFADDPFMNDVKDICLSYVFFKAKNQEDESESSATSTATVAASV